MSKQQDSTTCENVQVQKVNLSEYFSQLAFNGLRAYFKHVKDGNPEEYRTTFAKGSSLDEVLEAWEPHLSKVKDSWPSLMDYENDMKSKVGPLSIQKPLAERMDDIKAYYSLVSSEAQLFDKEAIKQVQSEFSGLRGLRVRGHNTTWDQMKKSTNSGCPYFTKRRRVGNKTLAASPVRSGSSRITSYRYPDGIYKICATIGWRGQEGGITRDDVKQRVVWMFPAVVNLDELSLYQPLIAGVQKRGLVPAWEGMDAVDLRITKLFRTKGAKDDIICTDFTKFDQHFNSVMQGCARSILASLVDPSTSDSTFWLDYIFPIKYYIPLMLQAGELISGEHGMGSGSGGTNADETLAHRTLQYEAALRRNQQLNPNSQCLGDDGVLSYPGIHVEDVIDSYSRHGLEMNTDKQYVSKSDCVYLRRWHHEDYVRDGICVGVYSTYRALGRLCEQERFYDPDEWGPEQVALRQLSILENCKHHPLFEDFVDFCMKRDKYRLGIDIPNFFSNISNIAKKSMENMPDFMGYTASLSMEQSKEKEVGIKSWRVVKYLQTKA